MNCISVLNSPVPQLQASKLLRSATLLCAVLQVFLFYLKMQGWRFDKANKTSCMLIWPLHTFQRRFCSSIMMLSWWVLISFLICFHTQHCRASYKPFDAGHVPQRASVITVPVNTPGTEWDFVVLEGVSQLIVVGTSRMQVLPKLPSGFSDTI